MNDYQEIVQAEDLSDEGIRKIIDDLINKLGYQIIMEKTPDYIHLELQKIKEQE